MKKPSAPCRSARKAAYTTSSNAAIAHSQIAGAGVRCLGLTYFQTLDAGNPSSRANAQMTREDQVTADNPQNHIAIAASAENSVPARSPKAATRIAITSGG